MHETQNRTTRVRRLSAVLALLLSFALVAAACGSNEDNGDTSSADDTSSATGAINISGSSTVEPISARAAELFNDDVNGDVEITVSGPGTGDGFAVFCEGETDISDASRAIKDDEAATCEANGINYVELLVAFDGIAVLTSPDNDAVDCLAFADLYALLGAEAQDNANWSDADAVAAELGSTVAPYPDAPLFVSAPGTESGTYDSFIEIALEDLGAERLGEDAETYIRSDFAGQANDNVIIEGIAGNDASLGWVGFAFADGAGDAVKILAVSEEPGGECVSPTIETIADSSYPVSRPLYIYVNTDKLAANP
ncbi:MAG: substrate-binding domain-containing protein, partial [Acidimicrobiia bacterium]|nr:substrate-binding domain-containing protein [Acidimicrobiia bacterium]MDH5236527.1 substrate-binding domain-containing protein [Acidimicrobiia bacterium]